MSQLILIQSYIQRYKKVLIYFLILIPASVGISSYLVHSQTPNKPTASKPQIEEDKEKMSSVVNQIDKQIELPKDEEPLLATVTEKEKLQKQDFFKVAENGDKILMYKKAKKAYLYRPSTDKVIAKAPLQFQDPETQEASSSAEKNANQSEQTNSSGSQRVLIMPQQ